MSRLFTFGCSFTRYCWPTWADILGREYEHFENWGQSGAGNQFIFNSLIECNLKNKLSPDDTIIIMWSNVFRQDRYIDRKWDLAGNLAQIPMNPVLENIRDMHDFRGYYIRDLATISAAYTILNSIGCKFQFHSMIPINIVDEYNIVENSNEDISDILILYNDIIKQIKPSVFETIFKSNWKSRPSVDLSYALNYEHNSAKADFKELYQTLAGTCWPSYDEFVKNKLTNISAPIRQELEEYDLFNKYNNLPKPNSRTESIREFVRSKLFNTSDTHPLPNVHLEYLQLSMPEIAISPETIEWVNQHTLAVQSNKIIRFNQHLPTRL
jgi:hypothetical protein